jgi:uncharacterized protein YndB with AHSA1/START domain
MKWLVLVALTIAILLAAAALIGAWLPRSHRARREAQLGASPDAVWSAITDIERFPSWRTDVTHAERLPDRAGLPAWVEESGSDRIAFQVERRDPPRLLVTRIADPDLPFGGTWTYEIVPVPGGSRITITENGEIYNPLFRFVARFFLGYERTLASYLGSLQQKFPIAARTP